MKAKFDYKSDCVIINNRSYPLSEVRDLAIAFYPKAVSRYFTKVISTGGSNRFQFDWEGFIRSEDFDPWLLKFNKYCFQDIRPVEGFSPDQYSNSAGLSLIYRAIRKQFVIAKEEETGTSGVKVGLSPLQTSSARTLSKFAALRIYCGVTRMHNFDEQYAVDLIGLNDLNEFKAHYNDFERYLKNFARVKTIKNANHVQRITRFHNKVKLVLKYIDASVEHTTYVSLSDLNH
jgi:hypothetical protein